MHSKQLYFSKRIHLRNGRIIRNNVLSVLYYFHMYYDSTTLRWMYFRLTYMYIYQLKQFSIFISVFRQGDKGKCWYAVMSGTLEVRINQPETDPKVGRCLIFSLKELMFQSEGIVHYATLKLPNNRRKV